MRWLVAALLLCSVPARADSSAAREEAKRLKDRGASALEQRDFAGALELFTRAYATYPSAKLRFNLGLAYDGLGQEAEALREFRGFLDGAPDAPMEARLFAAKRAVELERLLRERGEEPLGAVAPSPRAEAPASAQPPQQPHATSPIAVRTTPPAMNQATTTTTTTPRPPKPTHRRIAIAIGIAVGIAAAAGLALGLGLGLSSATEPATPSSFGTHGGTP
jgi:tetratricopeptide (TPR) repeat protein